MARLVKLKGPLRFRSMDPQAENSKDKKERGDTLVSKPQKDVSPFQRVKNGSGEFFLAADAIPKDNKLN